MSKRLHFIPAPPTEGVIVEVVSCTRERIFVQIPSWSRDFAIMIRREDSTWPRGCEEQPAIHMTYRCIVDFNPDVPTILDWQIDHNAVVRPIPLPPPGGMPAPPEKLPVLNSKALDSLIKNSIPCLSKKKSDREIVAYLIMRAHGQGLVTTLSENAQ